MYTFNFICTQETAFFVRRFSSLLHYSFLLGEFLKANSELVRVMIMCCAAEVPSNFKGKKKELYFLWCTRESGVKEVECNDPLPRAKRCHAWPTRTRFGSNYGFCESLRFKIRVTTMTERKSSKPLYASPVDCI